MTYHCPACDVNWWPYMAQKGACPECGKGTVRKQEPGSMDAESRYKAAMREREEVERRDKAHSDFEAFYAEREARLNGLDELPVVEPRRAA